MVHSMLDRTYSYDISGSNAKKRLTTVDFIVRGLHQRLMPLHDNRHTSNLPHRPSWKGLIQRKKRFNAQFSILDDEKTLQRCRNESRSRHKEVIWTRPHPEKHCIISWWLMIYPPCGPSSTNHKNCFLVTLQRRPRNCCCILPNVFCIVQRTEILILNDVVCEVGKSLERPSNVIL